MISRTHITEILGLGDMCDAGDVIDFQIKLPAHLRCSSRWPHTTETRRNGYGNYTVTDVLVDDNTTCQIRGIYRPSDGVLYTFLHMGMGLLAAAPDNTPGAGQTELTGVYGEVFVPSKFYICSNNSRLEVDTGKILGEGIIAGDALAYTSVGSLAPNNPDSLLINGRHYTTKGDSCTRTVMKFNKSSIYNTNYTKYRVEFSGVTTMQYKRKGVHVCKGWRVTRNVIK